MNTTSRLYASQRKIQWTYRTDLSRTARDVVEVLDTAPSKHPECWLSTGRIAQLLGVCESTVRRAFAELELKGLIAVVKDYALKTKRRIALLWREQPQPQPEEGAMNHEAVVAPEPARAASDEHHEGASHEAAAEGRKATPEEVAALVRKAAALGNPSRRWVLDACHEFGLANVAKAVDRALDKGKRRFGWAIEAAKSWAEQGGVPDYLKDADDRRLEAVERIAEIFGPGGEREWKQPTPTFAPAVIPIRVVDDRPAHLAWVNSPNRYLRMLAAQALQKGGVS